MKSMYAVLMAIALALLAQPAIAQTELTQTTLSAAVTDTSGQTVRVASATGIAVNSTGLWVDHEYMPVVAISGTTITVQRGGFGTRANTHASGAKVWVSVAGSAISYDPNGSCTAGQGLDRYEPLINTVNGNMWRCGGSGWYGANTARLTYGSASP